ncbi:MAG: hypothetical protein IH595_10410 [Bacteroidales bacterium]|nr:hypothetical protein [Bacteroidales bacterium]
MEQRLAFETVMEGGFWSNVMAFFYYKMPERVDAQYSLKLYPKGDLFLSKMSWGDAVEEKRPNKLPVFQKKLYFNPISPSDLVSAKFQKTLAKFPVGFPPILDTTKHRFCELIQSAFIKPGLKPLMVFGIDVFLKVSRALKVTLFQHEINSLRVTRPDKNNSNYKNSIADPYQKKEEIRHSFYVKTR